MEFNTAQELAALMPIKGTTMGPELYEEVK
jgi:hypothetical protein